LINGVARCRQYDAESLLDGFFVVNEKYPWPLLFHQSNLSKMAARSLFNADTATPSPQHTAWAAGLP
jgi:hypothetical protein